MTTLPDSADNRATLIGICAAAIMLPLDITIVGVALESIGRDLDASFAGMQWVVNAYTLVMSAFLLAGGALADRFGRRRLLGFGIILFTLASLLCGLAPSALFLNLARAIQGLGAAVVLSSAPAVLAHQFQGPERSRVFGLLGTAFGLGLALGPSVGGVLTDTLGWRWIFFVNIPVGLGIIVLALPRMTESRDPGAGRVDWAGLVTFTLAMAGLSYGLIGGPEHGWASATVLAGFAAALMGFALFVLVEKRQRAPMFDLKLFSQAAYAAVCLLALVASLAIVSIVYFVPLYLQAAQGGSALSVGLTMFAFTVPLLVVPALAGRLAGTAVSSRTILLVGLAAIGAGALWLSFLPGSVGLPVALLGGLAVAGIGAGICNGLLDGLAVSAVPPAKSGVAAGMFNTLRVSGDSLAIAGAGAVLATIIRSRLDDRLHGDAVLGPRTPELSEAVGRGDLQGTASGLPEAVRDHFTTVAIESWGAGFGAVMGLLVAAAIAGALITWMLLRSRAPAKMNSPPPEPAE